RGRLRYGYGTVDRHDVATRPASIRVTGGSIGNRVPCSMTAQTVYFRRFPADQARRSSARTPRGYFTRVALAISLALVGAWTAWSDSEVKETSIALPLVGFVVVVVVVSAGGLWFWW